MKRYNPNQPFLVIPQFKEQSTWGGDYIAQTKKIGNQPTLAGKKIGQSYELGNSSRLIPFSAFAQKSDIPGYQRTKAMPRIFSFGDIQGARDNVERIAKDSISLEDRLRQDAEAMLGREVRHRYGSHMPLLIKFTQALGNSFQIHIRPDQEDPSVRQRWEEDRDTTREALGGWLAKPESWYFLEKGCITLGIKARIDWPAYERCCRSFAAHMDKIRARMEDGVLSVAEGRRQAQAHFKLLDPWQYVNSVSVDPGAVVDLSRGGIHHSWEEDPTNCPAGNIVYEVQLDRPDELTTIRVFDKGKIQEDGTSRPLQIDDYFTYIDKSAKANRIDHLLGTTKSIRSEEGGRVDLLFKTPHYALERIMLSSRMSTWADETVDGFHHLFVHRGRMALTDTSSDPITLVVEEGWSVLLPAALGHYRIARVDGKRTEVLKTYIPRS